jgi:hypothetical protein
LNNVRFVPLIGAVIMLAALRVGAASAQTEQPSAPDAQPPSANVPTFRTDVVVTAERGATEQVWVPAATVAVDAATLRTYPALTLAEFLSFVPGFRVQQPALFAGRPVVSARGFFGGGEAEYVALLVDSWTPRRVGKTARERLTSRVEAQRQRALEGQQRQLGLAHLGVSLALVKVQ